MTANRYLGAAGRIPAGETRTFLELAALAGRPGAARAAGRALGACPTGDPAPWHRVVAADGSPARDPARAAEQLRRLREEGGRPREGESVLEWAQRRRAPFVAHLPSRCFVPAGNLAGLPWKPLEVEAIRDEASALSRGLLPRDGPPARGPGSTGRRRPVRRRRIRSAAELAARLKRIDWDRVRAELRRQGISHVPGVLLGSECAALIDRWDRDAPFERTIDMGPRGYGIGSYRYFREPLPQPARTLRRLLYRRLRGEAEAHRDQAPGEPPYPRALRRFQERCRAVGQQRGSTILIRYGTGGINHPHRDLYGKEWFPFQALVVLSRRGRDFEGGEFALLEERPGGEERWRTAAADRGDLVLFCSRERRELHGARRRRVQLRHGMKLVRSGERFGLGIVFHLAE